MNSEVKSQANYHEQQPLCTTRLPYRQGRKLTAVKVYTINDESAHLLVFGVPSLNLRQETKGLFIKFGKLLQFSITTDYPNERFTETYHAVYERIQSARFAKKMLDGKNFYGGSLHICYAPELENINELRAKLSQRRKDVAFRLQKNQVEEEKSVFIEQPLVKEITHSEINICEEIANEVSDYNVKEPRLDMSKTNVIKRNKRKKETTWEEMKEKICKVNNTSQNLEIIDFTSTEKETLTNINDSLNYKQFGSEVIKKISDKPLNKIIFNTSNR